MEKTVDDVRAFWDENPLLTGEIEETVGTKAWFENFDRIKNYDVYCGDLSGWVPLDIANKKMLDIGCGPGYWSRLFKDEKVDYNGIDISPKTIELARKSKDIFKISGELNVGNAEQIEFPDETFDYVLSEGVIHHTPNTQKCIDEIYRVLVKGGRASIGLYYKNVFLNSGFLFKLCLMVMRGLQVGLKGRGRESMVTAKTPEDFIRMYDGSMNPIGKAYNKSELRKMFSSFSEISFSQYYFPARAMKFKVPLFLHKILALLFGTMILIKLKK